MSDPLDSPAGFGADTDPGWRPSAAHDPADVLSTNAAHRVLLAVRQAWPGVYPGVTFSGRALARKLGGTTRPVQKHLAGDQPMTLADVLTLAAVFGDTILQAFPRRCIDLFPPAYDHLLSQWEAGRGVLPEFAELARSTIDWPSAISVVATYDADAFQGQRAHLLTAETYRYELAAALGALGVQVNRLECTNTTVEHSRAMTLYSDPRITILISDLRNLGSRANAAASLMRILYQTLVHDTDERVVVLVADAAATSQIEVHLPEAMQEPGHHFSLPVQQAVAAALEPEKPHQLLPDLGLTALGHAAGAPNQHVIALRVGK